MPELVEMLRKEESGLTVDRSLEGAPPDIQCFELFLTAEWRTKYNKIYENMSVVNSVSDMLRQGRLIRSRLNSGLTAMSAPTSTLPSSKVIKGWRDMTVFLQEFVENNLTKTDLRRVIRQPTLREQLFGIPPDLLLPAQACVLAPDAAFRYSSLLFLGKELDLIIFNMLSYSIFDLWFGSTATSILLCYLLDSLITIVRQRLGEVCTDLKSYTIIIINNISFFLLLFAQHVLSKKTLVDERFLI